MEALILIGRSTATKTRRKGVQANMEDTIVSRKPDGSYKATVNGRTIATGETQNEAGWYALKKRPNAAIIAQRVRYLGEKHEDQFRRIYPQKPE